MALPEGCRDVCRPKRTFARRFKPKDVGRIACLARDSGYTPAEIRKEVNDCLGDTECDCQLVAAELLKNLEAAAEVALFLSLFVPVVGEVAALIRGGALAADLLALEPGLKAITAEASALGKTIEGEFVRIEGEWTTMFPAEQAIKIKRAVVP